MNSRLSSFHIYDGVLVLAIWIQYTGIQQSIRRTTVCACKHFVVNRTEDDLGYLCCIRLGRATVQRTLSIQPTAALGIGSELQRIYASLVNARRVANIQIRGMRSRKYRISQ